jgi:hypothetical protein
MVPQASLMLALRASFLNREARRSFWEAKRAGTIPVREARFRKKKKPERWSRLLPTADFWATKKI